MFYMHLNIILILAKAVPLTLTLRQKSSDNPVLQIAA